MLDRWTQHTLGEGATRYAVPHCRWGENIRKLVDPAYVDVLLLSRIADVPMLIKQRGWLDEAAQPGAPLRLLAFEDLRDVARHETAVREACERGAAVVHASVERILSYERAMRKLSRTPPDPSHEVSPT